MGKTIRLETEAEFSLSKTLESGQCFRWERTTDGYAGVVGQSVATASWRKGILEIQCSGSENEVFWYHYFDLGTDYAAMTDRITKFQPLVSAAGQLQGMHLLRQGFWETLVSFILSSNSNIPRIRMMIQLLAQHFGREIGNSGLFTFPEAEAMRQAGVEDFQVFRGGYRCAYLAGTVAAFSEKAVAEDQLRTLTLDEARRILTTLPGVGPKVADCVLLFSGIRRDSFPVDVWVRRGCASLAFGGEEKSDAACRQWGEATFGLDAGFAQQMIFEYARIVNPQTGR